MIVRFYTNFVLACIGLIHIFTNQIFLRYGGERYEKRSLQLKVRKRFRELQDQDAKDQTVPWHVVNAAQSIDEVQGDINKIVEETLAQVSNGMPLHTMFQQGEYLLPVPTQKDKK